MADKVQLINDDCLHAMREMEENSIDTVICDPPYGIKFMGKQWDHNLPKIDIWQEALRVAKPGALLFAFGGTRTFHRMGVRIEDAGWLLIDTIIYMFGSGFPKAHDVGINVDKKVANAQDLGMAATHHAGSSQPTEKPKSMPRYEAKSEKGRLWTGWKTALKPAHEPILVFQKPVDGTYANNALVHGVAGFNIDGSRIGDEEISVHNAPKETFASGDPERGSDTNYRHHQGRYPANVILDEKAAELLDQQSGYSKCVPRKTSKPNSTISDGSTMGKMTAKYQGYIHHNDEGGASRFFYCSKPSKKEKNTGLDDMPEKLKVYNGTSSTPCENMNRGVAK